MRRHLIAIIGLLCLIFYPPLQGANKPSPEEYDLWYSVLMQDKPSGWSHHCCKLTDGNLVTTEIMRVVLKRGAAAIVIEMECSFTETPDGKPISCRLTQTMGVMKIVQSMKFTPEGIELTNQQAGRSTTSKLPLPQGQWMTPAATDRYIEKQFKAGAKEITARSFNPTNGMEPITVNIKVGQRQNLQVMGKTVPAIAVSSTVPNMPGIVANGFADEDGRDLKTEVELIPGMKMTLLAADRQIALAQVDPPEILAQMLLKPDHPIANPRKLHRAVYEIHVNRNAETPKTAKAGEMDLPTSAAQTAVWKNADKTVAAVTVDLDATPKADDPVTEADKKPSSMIDCNDPKVKELVAKALAGKDNLSEAKKAELLRAFIYRFIKKKDLSVGFASATEVARTAEGDCTEHGVLLAAMLRAAGIPSRTVTGLIYVDHFAGSENIFGYHMWARAFLKDEKHPQGRWVDLDGTLPGNSFDAAHITLDVSSLSDAAQANDMVRCCQFLGRVSIKVVEPKKN